MIRSRKLSAGAEEEEMLRKTGGTSCCGDEGGSILPPQVRGRMSSGGASGDSQAGGSQNHAWEPVGMLCQCPEQAEGIPGHKTGQLHSLMGATGDCGRVLWACWQNRFSSVTHGRGRPQSMTRAPIVGTSECTWPRWNCHPLPDLRFLILGIAPTHPQSLSQKSEVSFSPDCRSYQSL